MADLSVSYMGIQLKNPVIAGASGLTANQDTIKKIEQAGAGALVCKSLFEEEIQLESLKLNKLLHRKDNRLPLRFAGLLHGNIKGAICSSTGIMNDEDVIRMLLAGADAVQVIEKGISYFS